MKYVTLAFMLASCLAFQGCVHRAGPHDSHAYAAPHHPIVVHHEAAPASRPHMRPAPHAPKPHVTPARPAPKHSALHAEPGRNAHVTGNRPHRAEQHPRQPHWQNANRHFGQSPRKG